jgi:prevent-host-death family protein
MKHVAITEAKTQLNELVAEIESTGDDVVLTRDGVPVARLIRENKPVAWTASGRNLMTQCLRSPAG